MALWLTEDQEIREGVSNAFQPFLSDNWEWRAEIDNLSFATLNLEEARRLEVPFREEEVLKALNDMNGDKALGPDGFTIAFWQASWNFVKEDVMNMFRDFYNNGTFAKSLNSTFIVLIPKKGGAEDLKDFRPTNLVESIYKLLAKVLANRLNLVVGKVVLAAQNAFVEQRQITDASLIANEIIDLWQKGKKEGVICKLDIEKAYDSIN